MLGADRRRSLYFGSPLRAYGHHYTVLPLGLVRGSARLLSGVPRLFIGGSVGGGEDLFPALPRDAVLDKRLAGAGVGGLLDVGIVPCALVYVGEVFALLRPSDVKNREITTASSARVIFALGRKVPSG